MRIQTSEVHILMFYSAKYAFMCVLLMCASNLGMFIHALGTPMRMIYSVMYDSMGVLLIMLLTAPL